MPKRSLFPVHTPKSDSQKELVWVTQGKTQHAAFLLESSEQGHRVQWATSGVIEWIDSSVHHIDRVLSPRRDRNNHERTSHGARDQNLCVTPFEQPPPSCKPQNYEGPSWSSKPAADTTIVESSEESDDNEVEIVLVIRPPSPKRSKPDNPGDIFPCQELLDQDQTKADVCIGNSSNHIKQTSFEPIQEREEMCSADHNCDFEPLFRENYGSGKLKLLNQTSESTEVTESMTVYSNIYTPHHAANSACGDQFGNAAVESPATKASNNETRPSYMYPADSNIATPQHLAPKSPRRDQLRKVAVAESSAIEDSDSETRPSYTYRSSAYVQNLAEICHTILSDARWRIGPDQQRLFAWESGDDLSALCALSQLYDEELPSPQGPDICTCLLCRERKNPLQSLVHETVAITEVSTVAQEVKLSFTNQVGSTEEQEQSSPPSPDKELKVDAASYAEQQRSHNENEHERSMHLFCRLFYRKGPWFRLDDIYHRYYAPRASISMANAEAGDSTDSGEDERAQSNGSSQAITSGLNPNSVNGTTEKAHAESVIDQEALNSHLSRIPNLLWDIASLKRMGLLRSFHNEEECGKTLGANQTGGRGLLSADERKQILTKLGGGNGKKFPRQSNGDKNSGSASENQIWKQMCQQRSIIGGFAAGQDQSGKKKRAILPVIRHVNELLFDRWAASIVQACSRVAYISASTLKTASSQVKCSIRRVLADLDNQGFDSTLGSSTKLSGNNDLCVRLRDAPSHTLRRCVRLYLCATSGPGNMRGDDGTSGWKSVLSPKVSESETIPFSRMIPPPGLGSWHNVAYPGLNYRFGLASFPFIHAYRHCPARHNDYQPLDPVFPNHASFRIWEVCVEIRAQVDYLIELNETALYQERRRLRLMDADEDGSDENMPKAERISNDGRIQERAESTEIPNKSPVDFLGLLTVSGRLQIVRMLTCFDSVCRQNMGGIMVHEKINSPCIEAQVEDSVTNIFGFSEAASGEAGDHKSQSDRFCSDYERVLGVLAIIIIHVMLRRHVAISNVEVCSIASRPWLRHLCWEGCLNYMLWDIIPILERRGYYLLSVQGFEVLLFGRLRITDSLRGACSSIASGSWDGNIHLILPEPTSLAPFLLSRRARGKAYERLVLDIQHSIKKAKLKDTGASLDNTDESKPRKSTQQSIRIEKSRSNKTFQECLSRFCMEIINQSAESGSIPFSAIRVMSRRLKQPLAVILAAHPYIVEVKELGLRLGERPTECSSADIKPKYSDWVPITDTAVANAMEHEGVNSGRCSYVGFEDNGDDSATPRSLNVEELAMEYYATGRLPINSLRDALKEPRGGWVGWHDEGGHVRMLFRILCSSILGISNGCCSQECLSDKEQTTVHVTRYQGAPFDLHVGYASSMASATDQRFLSRGFYARRRSSIDEFLERLSQLQDQELCDLVHTQISARVERYNNQGRKNDQQQLERDLSHVRTLSMLAAGFGGQQLAAMFRCLFFDYRHYSGGLPDLLLVRALYEEPSHESYDNVANQVEIADAAVAISPLMDISDPVEMVDASPSKARLVDLGDWIGEEFHPERRAEKALQQHASMLTDMDDEFLGCSKVGDSGAVGRRSNGRGRLAASTPRNRTATSTAAPQRTLGKPKLTMPPRLEVRHRQRKVVVQCMMVEVKSLNDRLDPRQEDWLNVLDRVGNARVCKFGKKARNEKSNSGGMDTEKVS